MLCSDVAVCSAIRLGGSTLPSSRRPATGPDSISCRRWGTLAPPPWRRVLPAGPRPSPLRSTAGRRAALVLTSAHALEACSAACPLHCLRARGDVRLSSELSPSLTHSPGAAPPAPRRGRSRGLCALPTRGSAGGRHHRHSRASRGRSLPPRLYGKGGGRRARVCGCVRPDDGEAAAPQPLCSKRAPRRGLASPASPTRASCSVLGEAPARGARASWPVASACGAAAALACRHRCRLVLRDETLVFTAADALAATLRFAVRSAAVAAARSPRPAPGEWTRRYWPLGLWPSGLWPSALWPSGLWPCRASGHRDRDIASIGTLRPSGHCVGLPPPPCSTSGVGARFGARSEGVFDRVPAALPVCPRRIAVLAVAVAVLSVAVAAKPYGLLAITLEQMSLPRTANRQRSSAAESKLLPGGTRRSSLTRLLSGRSQPATEISCRCFRSGKTTRGTTANRVSCPSLPLHREAAPPPAATVVMGVKWQQMERR